MTRKKVCILDYGVGNLSSLTTAFLALGHFCYASRDHQLIMESDLVVLPGVGSFPAAMEALDNFKLVGAILERFGNARPILGVCLGMQLLLSESYEYGITKGLGIIPGRVVKMPTDGLHTGWNKLSLSMQSNMYRNVLDRYFYFNHSFYCEVPQRYISATVTDHGVQIPAIISSGRCYGLQFHPEKSQSAGKALLSTLLESI